MDTIEQPQPDEQPQPEQDGTDLQLSEYRRTRRNILLVRAKMGHGDAIEALRVEYGEVIAMPNDPRHAPPSANVRVEPI